jgi:cyclic beta-1,2-glucan synthetase
MLDRALPLLTGIAVEGDAARGAEWLLDNAWLLAEAEEQVEEALRFGFVRTLPMDRSGRDVLRAERVAREMLDAGDGHVDAERAAGFLAGYAADPPLAMAELWAVPAFVRLLLLERAASAAATLAGFGAGGEPGRAGVWVESLRVLSRTDWSTLFERASAVHATLLRDPAGGYAEMDFDTRDRYRKRVEWLARRAGVTEGAAAQAAVDAAARAAPGTREAHVGYWMLDAGRGELAVALGAQRPGSLRLHRALVRAGPLLYAGGVLALTTAVAAILASPAVGGGVPRWMSVVALLLSLLPASAVAVAVLNWTITQLHPPRVLPKLEFRDGIPAGCETAVIVPALLADADEVEELLRHLELNWLGNADERIVFALLADFTDAPARDMPGDAVLLRAAEQGIRALNARHGAGGHAPFLLLHRAREWNAAQGCWMGWERKRGKIEDFTALVLGLPSRLAVRAGDGGRLRGVAFAISLDADTFLPRAAACRMAGTLAHPLNRPLFGADGRVVAGYTLLQPRVELLPTSAGRTPFARAFEGDRGVDLYTRAVSDVYQDLFGEGNYAGKGIFDVAAFHRSLHGRVPENALLSHDLFEGVQGRAALVSDIAVYEDFPAHPLAYLRRLHRWVRGDWQLLPWLMPRVPVADGRRAPNPLSFLDRWKMADNLRRSLASPALLLFLAAGWALFPAPGWWTAASLAVLGMPALLGTAGAGRAWMHARLRGMTSIRGADEAPALLTRWGMMAAFLPVQVATESGAIMRTLWRVRVSRRRLLEWTSAAHTARTLNGSTSRTHWRRMAAGPALAAVLGLTLAWLRPEALTAAAPLLVAWVLAPAIGRWSSRPTERGVEPLTEGDARMLRALARRTWAYFDRYVGADDHWLPPDHVQEDPPVGVARRTSPTNVGLMALSTLAAYDLGYVPLGEMAARLDNTLDTLEGLERHRGHFLNWYGTHDLRPLEPRYVSTVDSGNLACALVALAAGCHDAARAPLLHPAGPAGLADALEVLAQTVAPIDAGTPAVAAAAIAELRAALGKGASPAWARTLARLTEGELPELEAAVASLAEERAGVVRPDDITRVRVWLEQAVGQARLVHAEARALLPWLFLPAAFPPELGAFARRDEVQAAWRTVAGAAEVIPSLAEHPARCAAVQAALSELRRALAAAEPGDARGMAEAWARRVAEEVDDARARAEALAEQVVSVAVRAAGLADEMDFAFLYDGTRHLFHIGYDASAGRLDGSWYDLLASEARLASLFAISRGQVPTRHWLHLGRPLTRVAGEYVLLSWSGSMFEYLLPPLLTRTPPRSLLALACRAAVRRHVRHGERHGVPWGVSESAYAEVDAQRGYQYRAFGVGDLALRRDEGERLVIAPYACAMALPWAPREAAANLRRLDEMGMVGVCGLYDAVDYGPPSSWARREGTPVRTWMAHHQGMVLLALDNVLNGAPMVERFHRDSAVAAVELLLHEQVPGRVRPEPRALELPAVLRPAAAPRGVSPWRVPLAGAAPEAQVLSNGTLSALVTAWGSGGLRIAEQAVTRWDPDPALEPWGTWIYVLDRDSRALWSATAAPVHTPAEVYEVTFSPHHAEFLRRQDGISTRMSVFVAPGAPVEVRRLTVANEGTTPRRLRIASCGEPALADAAGYRRHPAFSKLFLESTFTDDPPTIVFRRRMPDVEDASLQLGHMVVHGAEVRFAGWETDRGRFIGRGGSAAAPAGLRGDGLTGTAGTVLDPVFALACDVELAPGAEARIAFLIAAAPSEREVRAHLDAFRSPSRIDWALEEARARAEHELHELGIAPGDARALQLLLSRLVHPFSSHPAEGRGWSGSLARQQALWGQGISGDLPILLLRVGSGQGGHPLLPLLVRAHAWWRRVGVRADLVVLDEEPGGYAEPVRDRVYAVLAQGESTHWLARPGGVYAIPAARLGAEARAALQAAAAVRVDAEDGPLAAQLAAALPPPRLPAFVPVASAPPLGAGTPSVARPAQLRFDCGIGGFTPDGREYVIHLHPRERTPAPWINVIANPEFGFTVSESGGGYTWSGNSGEHRLTPWTNDPLLDPPGEALYLRDEETAAVWSPTPGPCPADAPYQARHGAGYTRFLHASHGLEQETLVFVPRKGTVKVVRVTLRNLWTRQRRVTATYYTEWVLGTDRRTMAPHLVTELERELGAVLARQCFRQEHGARVAFLASSEPRHGATADRAEFLGTPGSLSAPAALQRIGLAETYGAGLDPCAALQVHVNLAPGESRALHFLLGDGADRAEALELIRAWRDPAAAEAARADVEAFWDDLLGRLQVRTPEPAMDLLLNRWLPYQALSSRIRGRSALYQSSGAFGFRDQLQDVLAFLAIAPEIAREHLLRAAARQFTEGDVLHWWHPPTGAGVRTRCSDDLLWLPFAAAAYVEATGDAAVLDEEAPYLEGPELAAGEEERYDRFAAAPREGTLYEHCLRAIDRGSTRGAHGLPLMGTGDWNDAMDQVGAGGAGESVWLGWFLYAVLLRFAPLCEARGDAMLASAYLQRAEALRVAVESHGWDGGWYRRAWFDDGTPLGSARGMEGRIDSLTQSWAVLSGGADPARARRAMEAVAARLVREEDRLLLLLDPPFDRMQPSPGYIRAYPPGVRENGGQYTHAAIWAAWAFAALGDGDRAESIFRLLNPVLRVCDADDARRYRVEPYVVPADVYGAPPHTGRGGWTWYTGSAAWLYRLGVEAILGIRRRGDVLEVDPCVPAAWEGFEASYRFGRSTYRVAVRNTAAAGRGAAALEVDGVPVEGGRVPLADDGREHRIEVRTGSGVAWAASTGAGGR